MPYYPDEVIDEVRSRNDIVDVIGQYVRLTKKGSNYFGLCPFHSEKTGSFSVSQQKQMYYCFGCGAGGNVISFVREYESLSFPEAVKVLADRAGISLPEKEPTEEEKRERSRKERLTELHRAAFAYYYRLMRSETGKKGYAYFKERGLTDETMHDFGLGYSGTYSNGLYKYLKEQGYRDELLRESGLSVFDEKHGGTDRFWNRVMFPILDTGGKIIAFGGRVLGDGSPKYLNSPDTPIFNKKKNLYALNFARKSRKDFFLLCEGYMDVIALHQAGFNNAVASLGTSYTEEHARILKRLNKPVYLTFDSDGAGISAALRAIRICRSVDLTCKVLSLAPYKDPDELIKAKGPEEFSKRIETAENHLLFEIRQLHNSFDMKDPDQKTTFQRKAAETIAGISEELERENYIEAVAVQYQIGREPLRRLVQRYGSEGGITLQKPRDLSVPKFRQRPEETGPQAGMLALLSSDPATYEKVKDFLSPEDFADPLCRKIAEYLFKQLENGTSDPAAILEHFPEEEQGNVTGIFQAGAKEPAASQDGEDTIKELLIRIKEENLSRISKEADPSDLALQTRLIKEKQKLDSLKKK